jgi:hypothetical protein
MFKPLKDEYESMQVLKIEINITNKIIDVDMQDLE